MSRLESDLQRDVIKYLKGHKIYHYRTQMGTMSGLPDIIACVNGFFVGIELKREDGKGKPSAQQLQVKKTIEDSNGLCLIIDSIEELKLQMRHINDFMLVDMRVDDLDYD